MKILSVSFLYLLCLIFLATPCQARSVVGFLIPSSGLGDQSFNDMTYAGLIQARKRHNFILIREQCLNFSETSREQSMDKLISRGAGIIVVNGWEYRDLVKKYAPSYPERIFLINDFPLTGIDNVISIVYGQHEGAFLAGALAGWMSRSGKIGFIGGMDMPVIRAFQTGFHEGARFAAPSIDITDIFLSSPEEQHSGFNNPNLGYTTAGRMFDNGVDIIFATAGLSGNGVIQAARDKQRFVIGVDADQDHLASGYVLTSVMKRLDLATEDVLDKIFNKEKVQGVYYYGLEEAGVSLTPMTYTRKIIPTAILDKLAQLQQKIIDGEIRVTDVLRDRTPPAADSD